MGWAVGREQLGIHFINPISPPWQELWARWGEGTTNWWGPTGAGRWGRGDRWCNQSVRTKTPATARLVSAIFIIF